jgi:hypothetical protein
MTDSLAAIERGRRIVQERLKSTNDIPSSWTEKALRSEIETLELIAVAKDQELAILRQQLVESNKLLKEARLHLDKENQHFNQNVSKHVQRTLGVSDSAQVGKAVDRLVSIETKYLELVKAVCIRDRVDISKVSHKQILKSIETGESLQSQELKDEVKKPTAVAWTFH